MTIPLRRPLAGGALALGAVALVIAIADPGMWIAHAVAAALTILFLRRAELAVWTMLMRLGRVLATRLRVALAPVASGGVPRIPGWPDLVRLPRQRLFVASALRRGPPLLAF